MPARDVLIYLKDKIRYSLLVVSNPKKYRYFDVDVPLRATSELQSIRRGIYRGSYEASEIEALGNFIRPDDIVLELGSGCGIVSAVIAKRLADSRNLYTVEANPKLIRSITEVATANDLKPNIINAAIGTHSGEADFFFDESFSSSSKFDRGRGAPKVRVQVVSITELVERIRPTVIVLDIEGAERDILSIPLPDSVRVLCGEFHPHIIGDQDVSDIIHNLIGQGFALHLDYSEGRSVAFSRPRTNKSSTNPPVAPNDSSGYAEPLSIAGTPAY